MWIESQQGLINVECLSFISKPWKCLRTEHNSKDDSTVKEGFWYVSVLTRERDHEYTQEFIHEGDAIQCFRHYTGVLTTFAG